MDYFENIVDSNKFSYTNKIWNKLGLNKPVNVGYISDLIEQSLFNSKEEWKDYYFNSGQKRLEQQERLNIKINELRNSNIPGNRKTEIISELNNEFKSLDYKYGRTEKEIHKLGDTMYQYIRDNTNNELGITHAECRYMAKYRVIADTWNGIIYRERNTINKLQQIYPEYIFKNVDGDFDYKYGVDFLVYKENFLVAGIQVKPKSYFSLKNEVLKKANDRKNEEFKKRYCKEVIYIYSQIDGEIISNITDLSLLGIHSTLTA